MFKNRFSYFDLIIIGIMTIIINFVIKLINGGGI
jgi:hypothetical protein